jgi:peptide/nickel transport system ATP-binding protein
MVPTDKTALLRIRDLSIEGRTEGGWNRLIDGISLDIHEGEVMGIVGESGAGKSTLGLAAMGYVRDGCRFTGGSVEFRGIELISASRQVRRGLRSSQIAYVAQSAAASFNPFFRLIDQFAEFPVLRGLMSRAEARRDAVRLYRLLQLPDPEGIGFRYPHQVSGGQLQRMMTAMAMASRPKLIVFDEPTTALDVTTQVEVLMAIRAAVRTQGTASIYITHDLAVVSQMADRVMVLKNGRVVEEQKTESILTRPQADYTKSLWAVRSFQAPPKPADSVNSEPLCKIIDLSAGYQDRTVIEAISFDVGRGRTLAVVGESGSGKSTVARCLSGTLTPRGGKIIFEGREIGSTYRTRPKRTLKDIQIIFQASDMTLNPRQRVSEIVGRPLKFYHGIGGAKARAEVSSLLEQVELNPASFMSRFPAELSGGQRQRVGIARALAARPKLIICDEVISALDQLVAEGILRLLSRIQREQDVSLLFITHDIDAVRAIADEVMIMKDGRILSFGPKESLLTPPFEGYTKQLMDAVPEMDVGWLDRIAAAKQPKSATPASTGSA